MGVTDVRTSLQDFRDQFDRLINYGNKESGEIEEQLLNDKKK
jgi:hypothetical protein